MLFIETLKCCSWNSARIF